MTEVRLPFDGPFVGDVVRLDALGPPEADELWPVLGDPGVYTDEYVMHRRPTSQAGHSGRSSRRSTVISSR